VGQDFQNNYLQVCFIFKKLSTLQSEIDTIMYEAVSRKMLD
jgi:hypothetical protein